MDRDSYIAMVGGVYGYKRFDILNLEYYGLGKSIKVECYYHGFIYPKASDFLNGCGCKYCRALDDIGDSHVSRVRKELGDMSKPVIIEDNPIVEKISEEVHDKLDSMKTLPKSLEELVKRVRRDNEVYISKLAKDIQNKKA